MEIILNYEKGDLLLPYLEIYDAYILLQVSRSINSVIRGFQWKIRCSEVDQNQLVSFPNAVFELQLGNRQQRLSTLPSLHRVVALDLTSASFRDDADTRSFDQLSLLESLNLTAATLPSTLLLPPMPHLHTLVVQLVSRPLCLACVLPSPMPSSSSADDADDMVSGLGLFFFDDRSLSF